ncbi:hypothetical protein [Microbacterium xanthum]|uniref:hypothetical protein n=1 Tax=Microbacterium xanthum TaxID=3079794 RepID=UPI002AD4A896|nr:hypothetical protein [Microbacterium sp. KSW-48]MDZ8172286.1 hypothetical protein [Microbacterium sp. KSW-48]
MPKNTAPFLLLATVALVGALTACASDPAPAPAGGTSSVAESPTTAAPPADTAEPIATRTLPAGCDEVGSDASRDAVLADLTLQGDGADFIREAPDSAAYVFGCDWILEEVAGVLLLISDVDAADAAAHVSDLAAQGWTCEETGDETICTTGDPTAGEPVSTIVSRDETWIFVDAYNVDAEPLISDLIAQMWS